MAWKLYRVQPCDDTDGRSWDVIERATGRTMRQKIRTRAEARREAFQLESEAVIARLFGKVAAVGPAVTIVNLQKPDAS